MTTTPTAAGPPPPGDQPDRATRAAAGRVLTRDAANTWLTDATVADIGQAVAISITTIGEYTSNNPPVPRHWPASTPSC